MKEGVVYLVGAGPGDPDLLTRKAYRLLQLADAVFHDALVPDRILSLVPAHTPRVAVGRRLGHVICELEDVHRELVAWASRGATVVRLKGGDPLLFGRGGEELEALRREGVRTEVVPGVTAALAAAAALPAPLTQRGLAGACAFVSAHAAGSPLDEALRGQQLDLVSRSVETLAVYMGATRAATLAQLLIDAGRDPQSFAAVVERASLPDEQVHWLRLGQMARSTPAFARPALLLVGPTVDAAARQRLTEANVPACAGREAIP